MIDLDQLVSSSAPTGTAPRYVLLAGGTEPAAVVGVLADLFGSDDELDACLLFVGDSEIGLVLRTTVLDVLETGTKGLGDGDGLFLPGMPTRGALLTMVCLEPGCPSGAVTVVAYDEDRPPTCPIHVGKALERQT